MKTIIKSSIAALLILAVSASLSMAEAPSILKLNKFSYIENKVTGIEAFSLLIPEGWSFSGGIDWDLSNPGMPAFAAFTVSKGSGPEEMEVFPRQPFFWTNNQMLLATFPVGSKYFGNEVSPVKGASDSLERIIIPRFRKNAKGLKITEKKPAPELAAQVKEQNMQQGVNMTTDAASIRIEYSENKKTFEEEIWGAVISWSFSMPTMAGVVTNTNWTIDYVFSFKAEKGKLDQNSKLFQAMISSFRLNPLWFSKYQQLTDYLIKAQIQRINHIGEISRIISRTSNEISDMNMRAYNQRQKAYDNMSENFSDYVRGVERYYNPSESRNVELPSGYRSAWANSSGEYVMSEQEDFNPNIGSNLNWQRLDRK